MSNYDLQSEIEKAIQLLEEDIADAVAEERAAVVAWLRKEERLHQKHGSTIVASSLRHLGDSIEIGEHRREEEEP